MKECNFVNVEDLNQLEQQTFFKVSSLHDLKQMVIVPIDHRETVEDTYLGKTNTITMIIDTVTIKLLNWDHIELLLPSIELYTRQWMIH